MTATQPSEIAPLAVREFMPKEYLKRVQEKLKAKNARVYSDTVISRVIVNAQTTHPVWPIALQLAKAERKRREQEQQLNAQFLLTKGIVQ